MQVQITGKHMDVGQALSTHVEERLTVISEKYFDNPIEATVTFSKQAHHQIRADVHVHVGRGILVQAHDETGDAYTAFDGACDKIAKQLRRYKSRLKDHHQRSANGQSENILTYVLSADEEKTDETTDSEEMPAIIAEMSTVIETLTVGEAVMRLDLSNAPVVVFRNRSHGGLNVIYRREDGNISWIDPDGITREAEVGTKKVGKVAS